MATAESSPAMGECSGRKCQASLAAVQQTTDFHRTMAKVCKSDVEGTFAGTHGNGEVAPKAVILASVNGSPDRRVGAASPSIFRHAGAAKADVHCPRTERQISRVSFPLAIGV